MTACAVAVLSAVTAARLNHMLVAEPHGNFINTVTYASTIITHDVASGQIQIEADLIINNKHLGVDIDLEASVLLGCLVGGPTGGLLLGGRLTIPVRLLVTCKQGI